MHNSSTKLRIAWLVLLLSTLGAVPVTAQAPTPTPVPPQIVVVTATPAATPAPLTFWETNSPVMLTAVITAIVGLVFGVLLKSTFEKLGDKLAEAVGQLGSGWGFKKRYLTHLVEEYRGLNIRGLKTRAPVTVELEQVYVSLHAQVPGRVLGRQSSPAISIGQALAQHPRLAIVGGPGSGKTTLMAYLALTYARKDSKERLGLADKRLPILVPLRQLKRILDTTAQASPSSPAQDTPDVPQDEAHPDNALHQRLDVLATALQRVGRPQLARATAAAASLPATTESLASYLTTWYTELGFTPRAGFFEKRLRQGHCLVLLDGLDEVADETERRLMSQWVDRLVTLYPKNRYIVTSRPPGYDSAPLENGFTRLDVRDFDETEIRRFAENWCLAVELATSGATSSVKGRAAQREARAAAHRRAKHDAHNLVAAITGNGAIRKLAVNPLLLSIIALVHHYRATLPKRRVDLYAECVDVLLGHWDTAKDLSSQLDIGQKRAVLQALALDLHLKNQRESSRRELMKKIAALLPGVGIRAADAAAFLTEVRERSGLLVEIGLDTYAFSHLTFQEYLAALALVDTEVGRGTILAHLDEKWWQEVVLLYVGLTDATPVVRALLKDGGCDDAALLLAGHCVAEAVKLDPAVRDDVSARLKRAFETYTGPQFLAIGQVLANIEGADSIDFFLQLAHVNADRRDAALWALGAMGRQPDEVLRERVMARLLGYFQKGEWQEVAGLALAQVWGVQTAHKMRQYQIEPAVIQKCVRSTMLNVPAGTFLYLDEKHPVELPEFWIDRTPVTQAEYKQFLDATPAHRVPYIDENWAKPYNWDQQTRTYPSDKADHPVVLVSWQDARAYAQWAGKRLLTEEEWEKAARGVEGWKYPWGDDFDKAKCNTSESGIGGTTPVGRYSPQGDSPYGCMDMAGNVWEWTASDWSETDSDKVLRGGSWSSSSFNARAAYRRGHYIIGNRIISVGFRCSGS